MAMAMEASTSHISLHLSFLSASHTLLLPSPFSFSFSHLLTLSSRAFPDAPLPLHLTYLDSDGDHITIHDDYSLHLALASSPSNGATHSQLKIHITANNTLESHPVRGFHSVTTKIGSAGTHPLAPPSLPSSTSCSTRHSETSIKSSRTEQPVFPSSTSQQRRRKSCREFRSGSCRFGTNCNFLHHHLHGTTSTTLSSSSKPETGFASLSESELDLLLNDVVHASVAPSFSSSSKEFTSLMEIIQRKHLPDRIIARLVTMLASDKFRNSLSPAVTTRIFDALVGSELLASLHEHIRCNVKATTAKTVEPYVVLCEEVMRRCSDGWKEAPLDELRALVEEMGDRNELQCVVDRLLQQRSKEKKRWAGVQDAGPTVADFSFRKFPLIPPMEQLLLPQNLSSKLPVNRIGSRYPCLASYLDTHFRLMQEDCLSSLRDGIIHLRNGSSQSVDLRIYRDVKLADICCGPAGIVYRVSFHTKGGSSRSDGWAKQLMYGSLLCISGDSFRTFVWGVVADRNPKLLSIDVQLLDRDACRLESDKKYVMAESSTAYFEAYSHVLSTLQRPDMDDLPFQEHLVSLEPQVKEPAYLKIRSSQDLYEFADAFPSMTMELRNTEFHILQTWPSWSSSLDKTQMAAVRHGLTKRLALIQGPPGTGKTFVGLTIVKILLRNLKTASARIGLDAIRGPILVICYTNHALDQFVKGIYAAEKNIVRVGGRSKCPELETCNLQYLLQDSQKGPSGNEFRVGRRAAVMRRNALKDKIAECTKRLQIGTVTKDSLLGVADDVHFHSLFYCGCDPFTVVRAWIEVEDDLEGRRPSGGVWSLGVQARRTMHERWCDAIKQKAKEKLRELSAEYEEACKALKSMDSESQLRLLKGANVVGMTTTKAASYRHVLECLRAEVILVEEAAEIVESHILACLTSSTKHLILIGDHIQLRPSVSTYELAMKHNLDVSLFERLVSGGVEYVTLNVQRRMRPSISKLISSLYPQLTDHPSVSKLDNVKGIKSNVFFFHHDSPEGQLAGAAAASAEDEESSKKNIEEAEMVAEFCAYLLKQGYAQSDITILSMYNGQVLEISRRLARKLRGSSEEEVNKKDSNVRLMPRVSSVDDYQGEECKIILLSLVRSNAIPAKGGPGKIGFLGIENRVCVALSRAKNGLFIFGNGELLRAKSQLWRKVIQELRSSGAYGEALQLSCQNHPEREVVMEIRKAADFAKVVAPDGRCGKPCEAKLSCGHVCRKLCHAGGHESMVCVEKCLRKRAECGHVCQSECHGVFSRCPPCTVRLVKQYPACGHPSLTYPCFRQKEVAICGMPCAKLLPRCRHPCQNLCGMPCTTVCAITLDKPLPCGHTATLTCSQHPSEHHCRLPCGVPFPGCHHRCKGTCGDCRRWRKHIFCREICRRPLPCGDHCPAQCHGTAALPCPPCKRHDGSCNIL